MKMQRKSRFNEAFCKNWNGKGNAAMVCRPCF
jgi:hypothetical protein